MTSYTSRKARARLATQISALKASRIKNVSMVCYGVAVGVGYVFLMGFTIGYPDPDLPVILLMILCLSLALGRLVSALADLPRSQKRKVKRFFSKWLRLSLKWW